MNSFGSFGIEKAPGGSPGNFIIAGVDHVNVVLTDVQVDVGYELSPYLCILDRRSSGTTKRTIAQSVNRDSGNTRTMEARTFYDGEPRQAEMRSVESETVVSGYEGYSRVTFTLQAPTSYWELSAGENEFSFAIEDFGSGTIKQVVANYYVTAYNPSPPVIMSHAAVRCDASGAENDQGAYIKVKADWIYSDMGGENVVEGQFTWAQDGQEMSAPVTLKNGVWSPPQGGTVQPQKGYTVSIELRDLMDGYAVKTVSLPAVAVVDPEFGEYWGLLSRSRSRADAAFAAPVDLEVAFNEPVQLHGLSFTFNAFDHSWCTDMTIQLLYENAAATTQRLSPDAAKWYWDVNADGVTGMRMLFYAMNKPDRFLWIQRLMFGKSYTFTGREITAHSILQDTYAVSEDFAINTLEFSLLLPYSEHIPFNQRREIRSYYKDQLQGVFYMDDEDRQSPYRWRLRCVDTTDILDSFTYNGMLLSEYSAEDVVRDIADTTGLTIEIDPALVVPLTGWIPIATCRYALMQVAFAVGGVIDVGVDGKITIRKPGSVATAHFGANRCMQGVSVKKDSQATREVCLSSWSFEPQLHNASWVTEEDGTLKVGPGWDTVGALPAIKQAVIRRKIQHSGPYQCDFQFKHNNFVVQEDHLYWVDRSTGRDEYILIEEFQVVASNTNLIEFTWGGDVARSVELWYNTSSLPVATKNQIRANALADFPAYDVEICRVPLRKIETIHSKVNEDLQAGEQARIAEYKEYYLVSSANAQALLDHIFDMVVTKTESVTATAILENERIGDMVSVDTDFGVKAGIITSLDIDINNHRVARMEVRT